MFVARKFNVLQIRLFRRHRPRSKLDFILTECRPLIDVPSPRATGAAPEGSSAGDYPAPAFPPRLRAREVEISRFALETMLHQRLPKPVFRFKHIRIIDQPAPPALWVAL
jgi:hypothetical protein